MNAFHSGVNSIKGTLGIKNGGKKPSDFIPTAFLNLKFGKNNNLSLNQSAPGMRIFFTGICSRTSRLYNFSNIGATFVLGFSIRMIS